MEKSEGGPAFPDLKRLELFNRIGVAEAQREVIYINHSGMSLRAYIATAALQGILAADEGRSDPHGKMIDPALGTWCKLLAKDACIYADALLAELEK